MLLTAVTDLSIIYCRQLLLTRVSSTADSCGWPEYHLLLTAVTDQSIICSWQLLLARVSSTADSCSWPEYHLLLTAVADQSIICCWQLLLARVSSTVDSCGWLEYHLLLTAVADLSIIYCWQLWLTRVSSAADSCYRPAVSCHWPLSSNEFSRFSVKCRKCSQIFIPGPHLDSQSCCPQHRAFLSQPNKQETQKNTLTLLNTTQPSRPIHMSTCLLISGKYGKYFLK